MFVPLRGKLLVEVIPDIKQTASGLYLAESIKDIPHRGRVMTLGKPFIDSDGDTIQWDFMEGEIVHFKRNWGSDRDKFIILKRDDVFAVDGPRAVRDMVIIKRVYTGKIGDSTIVIPDGLGIKSNYMDFHGEVISVGELNDMGIKIGDEILFHRNEGFEVKGYKDCFSIKPRAILAKI